MSPRSAIYRCSGRGALRQGEIVTDLVQTLVDITSMRTGQELVVQEKTHPFAIIMTQDCDLTWDHEARRQGVQDRLLPNVLFCEISTAQSIRHADGMNSGLWNRIPRNKDERYHFLQAVPPAADALKCGLPELTLDFKRYFTIPTDEVYLRTRLKEIRRRCRLISPYLEHLASRFAYYQSRVGLPSDHRSE